MHTSPRHACATRPTQAFALRIEAWLGVVRAGEARVGLAKQTAADSGKRLSA